jgi:homogentisate 1,2-dioxygenase
MNRPEQLSAGMIEAESATGERTTTTYMSGFGNEFATEALEGALPRGQNSPKVIAFGLYAEQLSGTAFSAPRAENRRSWLYRIRPSAVHGGFRPYIGSRIASADRERVPVPPNRLRWDPPPIPTKPIDFVEGLTTLAENGGPDRGTGIAIHLYVATRSMANRAFCNADGEMLLAPQLGRLDIVTELGALSVRPEEIVVIPRGVKFRVALPEQVSRGYVGENFGRLFRLPELGPIGANGLANPRDFLTPTAAFEDRDADFEVVQKFQGRLWSVTLDHSPFDVVAWHGNLAPYKYDLMRFNALGTVSFDHPDPSIYTVLTSPGEVPGTANVDFVIFPPRWTVAQHTFRPPYFHRNVMSEFLALIKGAHDAKTQGFTAGCVSLHNCMTSHGPDVEAYHYGIADPEQPRKIRDSLAVMFESSAVLRPTREALESPVLQPDYDRCWAGFKKATLPE